MKWILDSRFWQENGILLMIIQNQIKMQQVKLPVMKKF